MSDSPEAAGDRRGTSSSSALPTDVVDVIVVGSGFGGLGAALGAAERGARVALLETLDYPGGCAGTFTRGGLRFEAGATLSAGLSETGLFGSWRRRHGLDFTVDFLDPIVEFRSPAVSFPVTRDRDHLASSLARGATDGGRAVRAFLARQKRVADAVWSLLEDPRRLPPFRWRDLGRVLAALPSMRPLLPLIGRPLAALLERHGVDDHAPLRVFTDALCQITVQCPASEAEAAFALATLDYYLRDTGHVRGGLGRLAETLASAIEGLGGSVHYHHRARAVRPLGGGTVEVATKRGRLRGRHVVLNLLPGDAAALLATGPVRPGRHTRADARVATGYGACMLYAVLPAESLPAQRAMHLQLVDDAGAPLEEGRHVFASIGDLQVEPGSGRPVRTATLSTHVRLERLRGLGAKERAARVANIQARMRRTLERRAEDWFGPAETFLPGSPRTFRRFTGRSEGAVGGIPRRAGLSAWDFRPPPPLAPGVHLVGDTHFPGQSTLAVALGGVKLAERLTGS